MSNQNLYFCPHCGNSYIFIGKYNIYCPLCGLSYSKKQIENISKENLLADEELERILHIFKTFSKHNPDALKKLK